MNLSNQVICSFYMVEDDVKKLVTIMVKVDPQDQSALASVLIDGEAVGDAKEIWGGLE